MLMSNVSENYRSDESFEEHFVLKLILVSTVFKFNIQLSFLLSKGNSNFQVTSIESLYIMGSLLHS